MEIITSKKDSLYLTKAFILYKLSLPANAIAVLNTLLTELNLFKKVPFDGFLTNEKSLRESLEGMFRVFYWRMSKEISEEEFSVLYNEWLKSKRAVLTCTSFFKLDYIERFSSDDVIYFLKKDFQNIEDCNNFLINAKHFINIEFNNYLQMTPIVGFDHSGQKVDMLEPEIVNIMDHIFALFDTNETGHLRIDRAFILFLALLVSNSASLGLDSNVRSDFQSTAHFHFSSFLYNCKAFQGRITLNQFKSYLLLSDIKSKNQLLRLKDCATALAQQTVTFCSNVIQKPEAVMPDLLDCAVAQCHYPTHALYTTTSLPLTDLIKNSPEMNLINHFLQHEFFKMSSQRELLDGIFIKDEEILAQILTQAFSEFYGKGFLTGVKLSLDLSSVFLSIIKGYNGIASTLSQFFIKTNMKKLSDVLQTSGDTSTATSMTLNNQLLKSNSTENLDQNLIIPTSKDKIFSPSFVNNNTTNFDASEQAQPFANIRQPKTTTQSSKQSVDSRLQKPPRSSQRNVQNTTKEEDVVPKYMKRLRNRYSMDFDSGSQHSSGGDSARSHRQSLFNLNNPANSNLSTNRSTASIYKLDQGVNKENFSSLENIPGIRPYNMDTSVKPSYFKNEKSLAESPFDLLNQTPIQPSPVKQSDYISFNPKYQNFTPNPPVRNSKDSSTIPFNHINPQQESKNPSTGHNRVPSNLSEDFSSDSKNYLTPQKIFDVKSTPNIYNSNASISKTSNINKSEKDKSPNMSVGEYESNSLNRDAWLREKALLENMAKKRMNLTHVDENVMKVKQILTSISSNSQLHSVATIQSEGQLENTSDKMKVVPRYHSAENNRLFAYENSRLAKLNNQAEHSIIRTTSGPDSYEGVTNRVLINSDNGMDPFEFGDLSGDPRTAQFPNIRLNEDMLSTPEPRSQILKERTNNQPQGPSFYLKIEDLDKSRDSIPKNVHPGTDKTKSIREVPRPNNRYGGHRHNSSYDRSSSIQPSPANTRSITPQKTSSRMNSYRGTPVSQKPNSNGALRSSRDNTENYKSSHSNRLPDQPDSGSLSKNQSSQASANKNPRTPRIETFEAVMQRLTQSGRRPPSPNSIKQSKRAFH